MYPLLGFSILKGRQQKEFYHENLKQDINKVQSAGSANLFVRASSCASG
jgi:hypothetical protein